MRWALLALAIFFFLHSLRDYQQMQNSKNAFTEFAHVWSAPQYEKYSLFISLGLGILFFVLYLRSIRKAVKSGGAKARIH